MPNNLNTPALPILKLSDLKDVTLILLNQNFQSCWNKIIMLAGGAGTITIPNTVIAQSFQNPSQTNVPTNNAELLTLGSALALFSPATTRTALQAGAFQTSATNVAQAQPLPQSVVSSQAPASSSSPGFPGQLAYDSGFFYVCVSANSWRRVATSSF